MNIFYLLLFLTITTIQSLICQNGAINILTRTKNPPYSFQYKCLCPYQYVGEQCSIFRGALCYLDNEQILKYNNSTRDASLQFQMQCYLKKLKHANQTIIFSNQPNSFYKLPLTKQQIQKQLTQQNYYIDQNYQIIWSNDTTQFDQNGNLLKNQNDTRTDQQIINTYPKYNFNYTSYFLGIPLYKSFILFKLTSVQFGNRSFNLQPAQIEIQQQVVNRQTKITGKFNITMQKQWQEFQVTKIQLQIQEYYRPLYQQTWYSIHRMSMKNARWRLFDQDFKRGEIISGDTARLPGSIIILLIFIMVFIVLWCARTSLTICKHYRSRENQKQCQ